MIRAIEINEQSGLKKAQKKESPYSAYKMAFNWDRDLLYQRINMRVDQMLEQGLLQEVQSLTQKYPMDTKAFNAIGYKEFFPYINGEDILENCTEKLKQNTRNFAKRQLTWFRKDKQIHWLEPNDLEK